MNTALKQLRVAEQKAICNMNDKYCVLRFARKVGFDELADVIADDNYDQLLSRYHDNSNRIRQPKHR